MKFLGDMPATHGIAHDHRARARGGVIKFQFRLCI